MDTFLSLQHTLVQIKTLEEFQQTLDSDHKELIDYINVMEEYVYTTKTDIKGHITDVSDSFCRFTGFTKDELIGTTHRVIHMPEEDSVFYQEIKQAILDEEIWEGDIQNIKKDGSPFWMHVIIFPRYKIDKELIGFSCVRHNITESKKLEEEVIHDSLTGLYNRRYYDDVIERELMRAKREHLSFSFVMMDVDNFKLYNDTYGHRDGDTALQKIAKVLQKKLHRASDFCFRLGGEEFGFFFTGLSPEASLIFTEEICKEIENLHIVHCKNSTGDYVTASCGLVTLNMQTDIIGEKTIYTAADKALYRAKKEGRNRVIMSNKDDVRLT